MKSVCLALSLCICSAAALSAQRPPPSSTEDLEAQIRTLRVEMEASLRQYQEKLLIFRHFRSTLDDPFRILPRGDSR